MSQQPFPALDIVSYWSRLNEELIQLVDLVPDEQLNWSPKPGLWNLRGILIHIAAARHHWMASTVRDGEQSPDVLREAQTKERMKEHLRLSWERVQRFLADPTKLVAKYQEDAEVSGHWIAFHLLEHDIHHRADILHYLALLGIEHPEVGTP